QRPQLRRARLGRHLRDGNHPREVRPQRARQRNAMGRGVARGLRRRAGFPVIWLALLALASAAYYLLALIAAARWRSTHPARGNRLLPPVSILKPVHGRDPRFYEAIVSHAAQDYPDFEILFGTNDPEDPALADIARLRSQ